jgi:hypothetical protein
LGPTPSLKYLPASKADARQDETLLEMIRYRERTGHPHPALPLGPTGTRTMTCEEAAATRLFRERYFMAARESDIAGTRFEFDRREYCQTYRREGEDMIPNQPELIVGGFNFVAPQSGRFPPGTCVDIHSHPNVKSPANAIPSDLDQRVAHQLRTNALHRPGTRLDGAIMYYPPADTFYAYTGEFEGPGKRLVFRELIDPYPLGYVGAPRLSRSRLRLPGSPYKPYRPPAGRGDSPSPRRAPREEAPAREARLERLSVAPWEEWERGRPGAPADETRVRYVTAPLAHPKPRRPADNRPGLPGFALPPSPDPDGPGRARDTLPSSAHAHPDPADSRDPRDMGGLARSLP